MPLHLERREEEAPSESAELTAFKKKVFETARKYGADYGYGRQVDAVLKDLGIATPKAETMRVNVTYTAEGHFLMSINVEEYAGLSEEEVLAKVQAYARASYLLPGTGTITVADVNGTEPVQWTEATIPAGQVIGYTHDRAEVQHLHPHLAPVGATLLTRCVGVGRPTSGPRPLPLGAHGRARRASVPPRCRTRRRGLMKDRWVRRIAPWLFGALAVVMTNLAIVSIRVADFSEPFDGHTVAQLLYIDAVLLASVVLWGMTALAVGAHHSPRHKAAEGHDKPETWHFPAREG
jgi:hypothetical protein